MCLPEGRKKQNAREKPARNGCLWGLFWIWIWYDEVANFWIYIQILYPFWQKDIYPDHISSNWIYILDIISLDIYPTQCWDKDIKLPNVGSFETAAQSFLDPPKKMNIINQLISMCGLCSAAVYGVKEAFFCEMRHKDTTMHCTFFLL